MANPVYNVRDTGRNSARTSDVREIADNIVTSMTSVTTGTIAGIPDEPPLPTVKLNSASKSVSSGIPAIVPVVIVTVTSIAELKFITELSNKSLAVRNMVAAAVTVGS